ncbi:hypothetical protein HETIRDRAFT_416287 [Heterobasidion irregulare TC 32-1]|uniref:Uncharacterized protein n=1 Tax=Heterobasidion irregulare (strain TC 32-1) TaxID=747525 RepID=W4KFH8_HETIT|nr:uncharacterized protein HETIRDRAFT_416287 [Heterobasidion irregulare TC 32-1]ETW84603.1 hypothetical protein HETIRDRAFT_416287 [Heterobasidion irregulare TC 32-1]
MFGLDLILVGRETKKDFHDGFCIRTIADRFGCRALIGRSGMAFASIALLSASYPI